MVELRGEAALMFERELRSALPDETDDEDELVCCVAERVGCKIFERELLLGDMATKQSMRASGHCAKQ